MALLGGAGSLFGPLLGAVPLVLLFEVLTANFPNYFSILLGIVFIVIVYLLPRGVIGLLPAMARASRAGSPRRRRMTRARRAARRSTACARRSAASSRSTISPSASTRGEIVGLIGPNGSGKTTVLNLISGALSPDAGAIRFKGATSPALPPVPHRAARRRAHLPARARAAARMTVRRERAAGPRLPRRAADRRAGARGGRAALLARVGLGRQGGPAGGAAHLHRPEAARAGARAGARAATCCCSTNGSPASIRPSSRKASR